MQRRLQNQHQLLRKLSRLHNLQEKRVVLIAQDSFYRGLTQEEHDNVSSYNFDHPDAFE